MRSHVLAGIVRHRRAVPFVYDLVHGVFYLALDLDELGAADRSSRLLGRNRRSVLEFRDADHWSPPAIDLRAAVHDHLRAQGDDPTDWRITLVTNPRILGYVFNPASFYLCRDGGGTLRVVVVEVHNTHGERHLYTLRPRAGGDDERQAGTSPDIPGARDFAASMEKAFYVSPFLEVSGGYMVRVRDEASRLRITINHTTAAGLVLHASVDLVRRRLTDRTLLRMLVRYPLVTYKTTLMIHWHALRLWLRGATFHRHREAAR